jgi:hypothetical protein
LEESPDQAATKLPASCSSMVLLQELWDKYGWDMARVEAEVLGGHTVSEYLASGDNAKGKQTNGLYQAWRKQAGSREGGRGLEKSRALPLSTGGQLFARVCVPGST